MTVVIVIVVFLLSAGLSAAAIYFSVRMFGAQASRGFGRDRDLLKEESQKFDAATERGIEYLRGMVSLDEVASLQQKREQALVALAEERSRGQKIEGELEKLQTKVDHQETKHNELKKGKEDTERLADQLKANKDTLVAEAKKLQLELEESQEQMASLTGEVSLTQEQNAALAEIRASLEKMFAQFRELAEIHTQSSTRFIALQKQFAELENEFRKLVDKELSGKS